MSDTTDNQKFNYFISEKSAIVIVSFIGPMIRESAGMFEKCEKELSRLKPNYVVINFRDVPNIADKTFVCPALARIQKMIRNKRADLKLSAIHPELKKFLFQQGVIRPEEICDNLQEALTWISQMLKVAA